MVFFIPLFVVLAGLTLFLSRVRYKAIQNKESPRVIVKGHTYSDSVDNIQSPVRDGKIENVRSACIIGAGHVGALTAIVLASKNPNIQFHVVDGDPRLIAAWNSDSLPVFEPGLEDLIFEEKMVVGPADQGKKVDSLAIAMVPTDEPHNSSLDSQIQRQRKLHNIAFSTNIHAGIAVADMIFLCVNSPLDLESPDNDSNGLDLTNLKAAIRAIAQVSTGHKIIVHKSTAPCGVVQRIKKMLRKTASPAASFDVLSNPEFLVQGTAVRDLLYPNRVIIGHVFSEDMSPEALTALKRLYTPWVPEDRIITMDAWSSELGKIAANAYLAQQISNINSLSAICESTNANINHLSKIVGSHYQAGLGLGESRLRRDVGCLVYLARELGLCEVADYWKGVLKMNDYQTRRISQRIIECLPAELENRDVAVLGFTGKWNTVDIRSTTALDLVQELTRSGVKVTIYDPHVPREKIERALGLASGHLDAVTVAEDLDVACTGCSAIVLHTDWSEFGHEKVRWQGIANRMESPKLFVDPCGAFDRLRMKEFGFDMLQVGVKRRVESS